MANPQSSAPRGDLQRRALEDSERKAAAQQPGSYKEEETEDKIVEVGPDMTDAPIKHIDAEG